MIPRKFSLFVSIVVAFVSFAHADTKSEIKMMDVYGKETISDIQCAGTAWGEFSVDISIGEGAKKPQYNGSGDVRLMYYNTLTIKSSVPMTEISFAISPQGFKQYAEISASTGAIESQGNDPLVWKGNAKEVTFTVGRSPKYSNSPVPNAQLGGQLCFLSVEISTDGETGAISSALNDEGEGEPAYYDLQGVRLNNPQKGCVVVRVQNGMATKIVY